MKYTLIWAGLLLAGLIFLVQYLLPDSPEFHTALIRLDTAAVTSVLIDNYENGEKLQFSRLHNHWVLTSGALSEALNAQALKPIMKELSLIESTRILAKDTAQWPPYQNRITLREVQIFEGGECTQHFQLGRLHKANHEVLYFIKIKNAPEVFAVNGSMKATYNARFDNYRNSGILHFNPEKINSIVFQQADNQLIEYMRKDTVWLLNDSIVFDAASIARYLETLAYLESKNFRNDFSPDEGQLTLTLMLDGPDYNRALALHVYKDSTGTFPYVIHSSQNPQYYFQSDSSGIYSTIRDSSLLTASQ